MTSLGRALALRRDGTGTINECGHTVAYRYDIADFDIDIMPEPERFFDELASAASNSAHEGISQHEQEDGTLLASYQDSDGTYIDVEGDWEIVRPNDDRLIQFQCQKEGTLFYYQHDRQTARSLVNHCPVCGSKRVQETGRGFNSVDENRPINIAIDNW